MEKGWKDDAKLMERIGLLKDCFNSIRDTAKNLLDLNRPGRDEKQSTNIHMALKQTLDLVKSNLMENKIKVHLDLSSEIPVIMASPQQFNHLFLNLINNAMEAITGKSVPAYSDVLKNPATGGEINISTRVSEGNIVIRVADNGPGISEGDLHHIFDPFYTRKKEMGIGMGLSICHGFVEDHGGTIVAENGVEGGAVFTITLPI